MKEYHVRLVAEYVVTAENVAQAYRYAQKITSIGERTGWKGEPHGIGNSYTIVKVMETLAMPVKCVCRDK